MTGWSMNTSTPKNHCSTRSVLFVASVVANSPTHTHLLFPFIVTRISVLRSVSCVLAGGTHRSGGVEPHRTPSGRCPPPGGAQRRRPRPSNRGTSMACRVARPWARYADKPPAVRSGSSAGGLGRAEYGAPAAEGGVRKSPRGAG